jgi:hypothetical protein
VVSLAAVLSALIVFLSTGDHRVDAAANRSDQPADTASTPIPQADPSQLNVPTQPASTESPQQPAHDHFGSHQQIEQPSHHTSAQPGQQDRDAYVEVYNNSSIEGLAARTAAALQDVGWQVVGTDDWYGDIPSNTVYYPAKLGTQAELLASDLGISRTHAAVPPMRFDRLTVILTGNV